MLYSHIKCVSKSVCVWGGGTTRTLKKHIFRLWLITMFIFFCERIHSSSHASKQASARRVFYVMPYFLHVVLNILDLTHCNLFIRNSCVITGWGRGSFCEFSVHFRGFSVSWVTSLNLHHWIISVTSAVGSLLILSTHLLSTIFYPRLLIFVSLRSLVFLIFSVWYFLHSYTSI